MSEQCKYCGGNHDEPGDIFEGWQAAYQCQENQLNNNTLQIVAVLTFMPQNCVVRVHEGGAAENVYASLAVSVSKLTEAYVASVSRERMAEQLFAQRNDKIAELQGAMAADDKRLREAAARVVIAAGCDAAEEMADEIIDLRKRAEAAEAIVAKLAKICGCLEPDENGKSVCNPPCIVCAALAAQPKTGDKP